MLSLLSPKLTAVWRHTLVYLLVACDRLDEKQEKKLKRNLPDLQAALQAYVDENEAGNVTLINDCESDDCEDWQLGISQSVKKKVQLKTPVALRGGLTEIHSPQGAGRRERIAETLQPQILPNQKRIPLPFLLAKVAHRITLPVLDGAHFTINAKLLGEIIEQSDRRLELHLLLH